MNKAEFKPTHFIEVYKNISGQWQSRRPYTLSSLRTALSADEKFGFKTLLIVKIKFKNATHE